VYGDLGQSRSLYNHNGKYNISIAKRVRIAEPVISDFLDLCAYLIWFGKKDQYCILKMDVLFVARGLL